MHYQLHESTSAKVVDNEVFILNRDTGKIISLNETGTLLWPYIQKGVSVAELTEKLTAEYEVSANEADTDIKTLLNKLETHHIITITK